jgi:hypothetical protein
MSLLFLVLIVVLLVVSWDWLRMAGSFVAKELADERREVNYLRAKLAVLKFLALGDRPGRDPSQGVRASVAIY